MNSFNNLPVDRTDLDTDSSIKESELKDYNNNVQQENSKYSPMLEKDVVEKGFLPFPDKKDRKVNREQPSLIDKIIAATRF